MAFKDPEKQKEYIRAWQKANPDRVRKSQRVYREAHLEKCRKMVRIWQLAHPEKIREYSRAYYLDHLEKVKEKSRDYSKSHPKYQQAYRKAHLEQCATYCANRRARRRGNGGSYTWKDWLELKKKYNYHCLNCKKQEPQIKLVRDHVIPVIKGGSNNINNIQPLCEHCNATKHTTITDFRLHYERKEKQWNKKTKRYYRPF